MTCGSEDCELIHCSRCSKHIKEDGLCKRCKRQVCDDSDSDSDQESVVSNITTTSKSKRGGNCQYCNKSLKSLSTHLAICQKNRHRGECPHCSCQSSHLKNHLKICTQTPKSERSRSKHTSKKVVKKDLSDDSSDDTLSMKHHKIDSKSFVTCKKELEQSPIEDIIHRVINPVNNMIDLQQDIDLLSAETSSEVIDELRRRVCSELSVIINSLEISNQDLKIAEMNSHDNQSYIKERDYIITCKQTIHNRIQGIQTELERLTSKVETLETRLITLNNQIKSSSYAVIAKTNIIEEINTLNKRHELFQLYKKKIEDLESSKRAPSKQDIELDPLTTQLVTLQLDPEKRKKLETLLAEHF